MARCRLCSKEFGSDGALVQHYKDKHPDFDPPEKVVRREALRRDKDPLRKKNADDANRRKKKKNPLVPAAIVIVVVVVAGVILYSAYGPHTSTTTHNSPIVVSGIDVGDKAADIPITLLNGKETRLSSFYGHTVLLWFVTTWCSSCQIGEQILSSQFYSRLHSKDVIILVVELYDNLGQAGPSISQFANQYGGGSDRPGWFYGTTTQAATYTYDPKAYLDIYYLINPQGIITDTNVGLPNSLDKLAKELGL